MKIFKPNLQKQIIFKFISVNFVKKISYLHIFVNNYCLKYIFCK